MGHGDGGMLARVHLGLEEPAAEAIAALDLEVYVASLDHELLFGSRDCTQNALG
jgi:hypothetical protein